MKAKVIKLDEDVLVFDNGAQLYSEHEQSCCENHYLTFKDLTLQDFEGLEFDLSNDNFFERVEDYGIRLIPITGHPVSVPGYAYNNGYYSSNLTLVLKSQNEEKRFDIQACQLWID